MASRSNRKGFSPTLPEDGWTPDWGTWEDYVERCVHEGARVYNDHIEFIGWINDGRQLHREDGPAREISNGHKEWWVNGKPHRLDGPAFEHPNGTVWFYKEGIEYTDITFTQRVRR